MEQDRDLRQTQVGARKGILGVVAAYLFGDHGLHALALSGMTLDARWKVTGHGLT